MFELDKERDEKVMLAEQVSITAVVVEAL